MNLTLQFRCATMLLFLVSLFASARAQDVLPFPPTPSASQAGVTIESSIYKKRVEPKRLPEDAPASSRTEWTFDQPIAGMPESAAPKLGKVSSLVAMEVVVPEEANGVLYALAGFSGGLTCYWSVVYCATSSTCLKCNERRFVRNMWCLPARRRSST